MKSACQAVSAERGTAAAWTWSRDRGLGARSAARTATYSAASHRAGIDQAVDGVAGGEVRDAGAERSTTPETSWPGMVGRRSCPSGVR